MEENLKKALLITTLCLLWSPFALVSLDIAFEGSVTRSYVNEKYFDVPHPIYDDRGNVLGIVESSPEREIEKAEFWKEVTPKILLIFSIDTVITIFAILSIGRRMPDECVDDNIEGGKK